MPPLWMNTSKFPSRILVVTFSIYDGVDCGPVSTLGSSYNRSPDPCTRRPTGSAASTLTLTSAKLPPFLEIDRKGSLKDDHASSQHIPSKHLMKNPAALDRPSSMLNPGKHAADPETGQGARGVRQAHHERLSNATEEHDKPGVSGQSPSATHRRLAPHAPVTRILWGNVPYSPRLNQVHLASNGYTTLVSVPSTEGRLPL